MKKKGKIFIISGPSGSGKTTLYKKLLADPKLKGRLVKSVSITTRKARSGEVHGRDYVFVSLKMFLYKKSAGQLLEYEKVFDNYYGTPRKIVKDHLYLGHNVLLCLDVNGAAVVGQRFPSAISIFIKTSSLHVLKERLSMRGSESQAKVNIRFKRAKKELGKAKNYHYVIINDDLRSSYSSLRNVILEHI